MENHRQPLPLMFARALKIDALDGLGGMLDATPRNEGGRPTETRTNTEQVLPTLATLGIDRKTAALEDIDRKL